MDCHEIDLKNTSKIIETVNHYYPNEYTHTTGSFDRFDVDWTTTTTEGVELECRAEAKLRKGKRMEQYPNAYLNSGKWRWLMENIKRPYAWIGYDDGVIIYKLRALPKYEMLQDVIELAKRADELPADKPKGYVCPENRWARWEYVWNPARGRREWELNVKLPITNRNDYKGITMLKHVN